MVALGTAYLLASRSAGTASGKERSAGLRTFPLVALATCGFIQATETLMVTSPEAMARIVEGAIVGMGFIGGGAILRHSDLGQGHRHRRQPVGDRVRSASRSGWAATTSPSSSRLIAVVTLWVMEPLKRLGHLSPAEQKAHDRKRARAAAPDRDSGEIRN
jgi:putative Mg2+ transporter-C (MgtC) family protein